MSAKESFDKLESKFSSLDEYLLDIKKHFADQIQNQDPVSTGCWISIPSLTHWCSKRLGVASRCMVFDDNPTFLHEDEDENKYMYDYAINIDKKTVSTARYIDGNATISMEKVFRSKEDGKKIEQLVALNSEPFDKAKFVLGDPDADRLLGEMMTLERKEFFWCHLHGLMHLLEQNHKDFALCKHGPGGVDGHQSYELWPSREPKNSEDEKSGEPTASEESTPSGESMTSERDKDSGEPEASGKPTTFGEPTSSGEFITSEGATSSGEPMTCEGPTVTSGEATTTSGDPMRIE